jgi:glycosyltransferase involved in cell wall biosynthesis
MNVLIITQYFHPEVGATQNRMESFARAFVRRGHSVKIITEVPNHPQGIIHAQYRGCLCKKESWEGCRLVRLFVLASPRKTFLRRMLFYNSFMLASGFMGMWSSPRPDIVISTSPPIFTALSGFWIAACRKSRFVLDVRDLWPAAAVDLGELKNGPFLKMAEKMEKFLYRNSSLIQTTTNAFRQKILDMKPGCEVEYVPNGTELDVFSADGDHRDVKCHLGFEDRLLICFAGNLGIAQDLDLIVDCARKLQTDSRFAFLIIGSGPQEDNLRHKVEDLGLSNLVILRQVPKEQISAYLCASDILLVTLKNKVVFESFVPSKLFDYMACERPVILNVPGEASHILNSSGGGICIAPGDSDAMIKALNELAGSAEARIKMGEKGRKFVAERFDRRVIADGMVRQMERLLEQDPEIH